MKQRPRIYYTESQKALMWERWRKGDSLQKIAQLFDRNHSSVAALQLGDPVVFFVLVEAGNVSFHSAKI